MPYRRRRRYKRRYRKGQYRRRRYGKAYKARRYWTAVVRRTKMPLRWMPQRKTLTLKYNSLANYDPGQGLLQAIVFRANSCYDPDQTGAGAQPRGFDQLVGTFYNSCTVVASVIKVRFSGQANATAVGWRCGVTVSNSSVATDDFQDYLENNTTSHGTMGSGHSSKALIIKNQAGIGKWFGRPTNQIIGNEDFITTSSGNPTEEVFYHVWVSANDKRATTDAGQCEGEVTIWYRIVCTDPIYPENS